MKKMFMQVLAFAAVLFPDKKLEGKENLQLSAEELAQLDAESNTEGLGEKFLAYYNSEYVKAESGATVAFGNFMTAYDQAMAENNIAGAAAAEEEEEGAAAEVPTADAKTVAEKLSAMVKKGEKLLKTNAQLAADNAKLKTLPEPDAPLAVITVPGTKANIVQHSKTHLFASKEDYNSLDRPWNRRAAAITPENIKSETIWDKVNIDKLNADLGAYSRRNSNDIRSMIMDGYDIPAHWQVISNIQDQYVFSAIATGEITQGFKKGYLAKNKQRFVPIINKTYDKQIDITWGSSELKEIEKSWLNMFFNEGSTPYKMSFARYLLSEIMKRARQEDKISLFNGVYFDTELLPEGTPGSFLNSMDGFLKRLDIHRNSEYLAHDLPTLTPDNTFDTIQDWLENKIPHEFRNMPGLKLGLGSDVHRWYWQDRERQKGVYQDYEKQTMSPQEFTNIEFVKHHQFDGTGFLYLTTTDNIGIMIDRPGEDGLITIELDKREINAFGDYKHGIFLKALGAKVDPDAALDYKDQIFFSNNAPSLTKTYVPVIADDATPSVAAHRALVIGSNNTAVTNITKLDDVVAGQRYHLLGDASVRRSTLKTGANVILDGGDFLLDNGSSIELIGLEGGKVIEVSRTVAGTIAEPTKVQLGADATAADAEQGSHFVTQANTQPTALTTIVDAIAGESYTIEGGSATAATTIANGGNFLLTADFTANEGSLITVLFNGSKFIELSRA